MSIHASERRVNAIRSLMVVLAAADLGGALLVPDGDEVAPAEDTATWVRVTVHGTASTYAGRVTSLRATREDVLVTAEVYARSTRDRDGGVVDAVDGIADAVASRLRYMDVPVVDYVGDPSGATAISGVALRLGAPIVRRVAPSDGYTRRVVDVTGQYFSRHAG